MKKYRVAVIIRTMKTLFYEVEAEKQSDAFDKFYDGPKEDFGRCIGETTPEIFDREIRSIEEV